MATGVRPAAPYSPTHSLPSLTRPSGLLGGTFTCRKQRTSTTQRSLGLNLGTSAENKRSSFFDRQAERDALQSYLQSEPTTILVILGPRSSGKTALLQEILSSSAFDSGFPPSYLDARSRQLSEASVLVSLLQENGAVALQKLSKLLKNFADSGIGRMFTALSAQEKVNADTFSISGEKVMAALLRRQSQSMNDVIAVYDDMLKLYKSSKSPNSTWPIICIDEANVLTQWQYGSLEKREALSALLKFFVKATKQENLAHVILATSDYAFLNWLTGEIGDEFFCPEVIGDFPKEEAYHFFISQALFRANREVELSEGDWAKVWEVCGGNAGQLLRAASAYRGNWDIALFSVWNPLLKKVQSGLDGGEAWSPQQYSLAVRSILSSAHHAVPFSSVKASIGTTALEGLVQANLLSYRPMSYWARDLPAEAHGPDGEAVVTAPTPGKLYCMARLENSGKLVAKASLAEAAERDAGTSSSNDASLQQSSADIKKVDESLTALEDQLTQLDKEIAILKGKGATAVWRDEVAVLRKEKEQLRKEKEQLRRKEEQLREEKLILMRQTKV